MNKSQIKLLLAIKIASTLQKEIVQISLNKKSIPFLIVLYTQGLIQNFIKIDATITKNNNTKILIYLRYFFNKSTVKNLKILSKPSLYISLRFLDLCLLQDKRHILFLSTSHGILTNLECKIKKVGGVALFKC